MTPKRLHACLFAIACFVATNLHAQFESIADTLYGLQWEMLPFPSNHAGSYEKNGNTYFCVAKGGLWFSNNDGLTFEEHPQFGQDAGVVTVLANNGVLVMETKRILSESGSSSVQYRDYYRSTDNGATWALVHTLDASWSYSNCKRYVATLRLNNSGVFYINWLNESCNVPTQNFKRIVFSADNGLTWTVRSDIGRRNTTVLSNTVYNFDKLSNQLSMTIVYDNNFTQVETVNLNLPGNFSINTNVSLALKHNNTFLVYDYDGNLYQTTDYGNNWTTTVLPLPTGKFGGAQCIGNDIYLHTNKGLWRCLPDAPLVLTPLYSEGVSANFQPIRIPGGELWLRNSVNINLRSLDDGATWEQRAINIPSVSTGLRQWCDYLAVGASNNDTIVFRSQAGGSWEQLPATSEGDIYFYKYLGESHGYLFRRTDANLIERSSDCGYSWEPVPQQLSGLQNVGFLQGLNHQNKLYVWYHDATSIFVTPDGGASWTTLSPNTFLKNLYSQGDTLVYSGGTNNSTTLVGISTDGGATWSPTNANLSSWAYQGLVYHNRKWYKLQSGQNFSVYVSEDWGQTWVQTCTDFYPYEQYNTNYVTTIDDVIFIHAAQGLYLSANDGVNWMRLPNLPFHSATNNTTLEGAWNYLIKDGYLYAQSFDDGIWRTSWQTIKDALVVAQGEYGVLSGKVFLDKNGDCIIDGTSIPLVNKIIGFEPGGRFANVQSDGWFRTALPAGVYDVIAISDSMLVNVCTPTNGLQVTAGQTDTVEIVHTLKPDIHNLCVEVFNNNPARPGFPIHYTVVVRNLGSEPEGPVTLFLNYDQAHQTFISGPLGSNALAGVVTFDVPFIDVFQQLTYVFEFEISPQTALGTALNLTATLPLNNDIQPDNNISSVQNIVRGAYDPNDKTLLSEAPFVPGEAHNLMYRIRFQNTGTDTAFTVRLLDTIDTRLDLLTLETVNASHDYVFNIRNNRVAEWSFKNILLPDSTTNEPESHGFVVFRIRSKPLELGDSIPNSAGIYFDYNDPVITNTAQAEIEKRVVLTNVDVELCEGDVFDGQTIAGNTTVYDTTSTVQTDSVFAFRITAHPTYDEQYYVRLKRGSPFFDLIITRDTVISFQTLSVEGCDSTVTFNIHVLPGKPVAGSAAQLTVSPNPASTGTLVTYTSTPDSGNTPKLLTWRLYDQRGALLQSGTFVGDAVWLERGACPAGTYNMVLLDETTRTVIGSSTLIWAN